MADPDPNPEDTASGVQNLIDRIRDDGVKAAEDEARHIVRSAERKVASMIADAKVQAKQTLEDARARIASERHSAEESLKLAARDTIQELGLNVRTAFERQLKRFVTAELEDREFLRQIILALASRTAAETIEDKAVEIILSESLSGTGAGSEADSGDEAAEERLRGLILNISGAALREGVEFKLDPHLDRGVSVRVIGEELRIDLNEATISDFLIRHLLPRYRRILAGEYPQPKS